MIACSDDSNHIIRRWNAMDDLDDDIDDRINDHLIRIADNNDDADDDFDTNNDDDDNDNEYDPDHIIGDPDHIIECIVTSTKNSHHNEIYENEDEVILAIDNGYSGVVLASSSSSSDRRNREHAHERDNMVVPQNAASSSSNKCVLPRGRGMVPYDDDTNNENDSNNGIEMLLLDNKLNKPNRIVGWNDIHGIVSLPVVVSKIGSQKQKQEKENDDGSSTIDRKMVAYDEDENGNEIIVSSSNNKCVLPRGRGMVPYVDDDNNRNDDDNRNDNRRSVRGMVPSSGGKEDKNINNERKGNQQQQRGTMVPIMSSYEDGQDHYPVDIDVDVDVGSDDVIPSRPPLPLLDDKYWNDENGHQWKVWNPLPLDYKSPNANAKPAAKSFPFNPNAKTFTPSFGGATNNNPALPQQQHPHTKPILTPPLPPPPVVATTTSTKKKSSINNDKNKNKKDKNTIGVIVKRSNLNKSRQAAKANHQNKENNNSNNNSNNISSNNSSNNNSNSNSNSNSNNRIGVIVKRSNLKKDRQRNRSSRSNSNSYISINNDIATTTSTSTSGGDDDVVVDDSNNHSNNNNKTTTPTSNNNNTVSPSNSIYSSTNFDLDSDEEDNTEDNDDDDDVLLDDDINDNIDASRYTRSIHSMPVLEEVTEEESPLHSSSVKNSNKKSSDKYCHPFSSSSSPSLSSSSLGGGSSASESVPTTSASSKGSSIANNNTGGSGDVDDEAFFQSQREQVSAAAARVGGLLLCVETVSTHSQSENDNGSDSSQYIKINDVEKGMMVRTSWNDKKNGRQLLKDDDDNDDDVEREGKSRIPIVTPWFRRKDFITIALIILIGIIVGCIAFLTLYLTVVVDKGGKTDNLGLISSEESESSAEESSSSSSNNGEFVLPWSDPSPPIDTTIDNGSNVDTDEDFGITTTVSTTASEEGRDNDNTSGTSTPVVVVEEATTTSSPTSTPIDNDSNVDTDEDFGITTTVSTTTPSDEEGRDNDKTSGTSTPVIVVVEEATTTTTASSPTPSPIQQIVPSQQPVIVATDTITDSSTPSTTTNGNINGGDNNNNNHSTNNSRLIPVIKDTDAIQDIIKKVRRQIELLIFDDDTLIGSFLRLVFHDCVGGCDGCIDLTNPENNGLDIPINTLQPIVDEFTNVITTESSSSSSNLLSRTDIWMLSSLVATEIALPFLNNDLLFPLHWIGRQTCEQKYSDQIEDSVLGFCGLDFFGTPTKCAPTLGPHIKQPHGSLGTQSIQDFFEEEFNFNPQQITALMGAHSVGRMHRHNSGFDGTWDLSAGSLDGGYWLELIGDPPDYFLESIQNNDLPDIPDRKQWRAIINHDDETDTATIAAEQKEQKTIAMLNVDIALVKNVLDMDETTGDVGCGEVNNQNLNDCSDETPFWPFANVYNGNNRKFLTDFREVLNHLIDHGYNDLKPLGRKTICPNGRVCTFGFTHNNDPKTTDSSDTVVVAIVEELSPPPTPSPSRSPPRMIPWVTNGPKIEIDRLCYDTVGENLVVTYNLFLEKQDRSVTDITIQVFDMNNIEIVMLENEKEQDIILNPRVSNDLLLSSLSCGEDTCHTWTSRGGLQMSTTNLIGNGQDYGVLLLANTSPTTDDANANINNENSRLEILAGVSFRLGGCNE